MERISNLCALAPLLAVVLLLLVPARGWRKEETLRAQTEARPECCVSAEAQQKRYDDIDYDTFVSLMGRRSAARPQGHRNELMSRKAHLDHILTTLLGRGTRMACPCTEYFHDRRR